MHKKLAAELRKRFLDSLGEIFPGFREDRKLELPPGWRGYRCDVADGFTAFVILCLSPQDDRFTIEIAWSIDGSLSASSILHAPGAASGGESIRLSSLWHPQRIDFWWSIGKQRTLEEMAAFVPDQTAEEKMLDLNSKVSDAIVKLKEVGIPYFNRVANNLEISVQFGTPSAAQRNGN